MRKVKNNTSNIFLSSTARSAGRSNFSVAESLAANLTIRENHEYRIELEANPSDADTYDRTSEWVIQDARAWLLDYAQSFKAQI